MKYLYLYDFDGTLTTKDTLFEIAKFERPVSSYYASLVRLAPIFALMAFKLMSKQKGKELFLKKFFGTYSRADFQSFCIRFGEEVIPSLIRPGAVDQISQQIADQHKVMIVSASPENWIKPWADTLGIEVIATHLSFEHDRLVGIDGKNCNGEEKVARIREAVNLEDYEKVIAYGDTKGDLPMLALAHKSHYQPFR